MTQDQLRKLPAVYRDFLLALAPVVESKREGSVVKIAGVPFSHVFDAVTRHHEYDLPQVRQLAENLKAQNYIFEDRLGFLSPTARGEDIIHSLVPSLREPALVPPLPDLD